MIPDKNDGRLADIHQQETAKPSSIIEAGVSFNTDSIVLITGTSNPMLANNVGIELAEITKQEVTVFDKNVTTFADSESRIKIQANMRRKHVFIIQSTCPPNVDKAVMELFFMIDAAKRASAQEVTAVIPYFGYARQDRKDQARVPISASVVSQLIKYTGADRFVTLDIHAEQEEGFVQGPWDNLYGNYVLIPKILEKNLQQPVIVSPDEGGIRRVENYAANLETDNIAIVWKNRNKKEHNQSKALGLMGNVEGSDVLLIDDMIDTAGTIVHAAELLKEHGAQKIYIAATHGLFSKNALKNIESPAIEGVIVTDTVAHRQEVKEHPKIEIVSVAPLLAEAIRRIETGESISEALIK